MVNTYQIHLEDLLANAFIERLKNNDTNRFIFYKEIETYADITLKSICSKNKSAELYLSRDRTNKVIKTYSKFFEEAENGIKLKSEITQEELIKEFRGYLTLFLLQEYVTAYKKLKGADYVRL